MYYLRDGLRSPALAWIFALVAAIAALTTTPFTQPNSMALVVNTRVRHPEAGRPGSSIAVLTWLVIIGGIKSIGRAAEKLSPLKVGLYLVGGLIVILVQRRADSRRAGAGRLARRSRCSRRSGFGMFVAMRYGIARGIYANEAGYGTAAVAYGTAQSAQPVAAGAQRGHRGVHRLVRDLDDQRDDDPPDRRVAVGPDEHAPPSPPASTP